MQPHSLFRITLLVLSTHVACGGLSERPHPNGGSNLAVKADSNSGFAIVSNPDDCTQVPPSGVSCILQISFQPLAPQPYQDQVIGGAGCVWASGILRGRGILPCDGGLSDAGALDSGLGIEATPADAGGN